VGKSNNLSARIPQPGASTCLYDFGPAADVREAQFPARLRRSL